MPKIRWARMHGYKTLLLPGTDHAAIATQAKVERILMDRGMTHPRTELGRDALLQRNSCVCRGVKSIILSQIRAMGTSCDWSRLAYTFDEPRSNAVNAVFKKMYDDGLIYRGHRVVNWSVTGRSTCSDDEVERVLSARQLSTHFVTARTFLLPSPQHVRKPSLAILQSLYTHVIHAITSTLDKPSL